MPALFRRGTDLPVDDTDSHFQYEGSWEEIKGSSRQWGGGVMATQQSGASVSFTFFGSNTLLYQTIPSGSGNVVVDVSVDGGAPTTVTNACGGAVPLYHNVFFQTPIMADTVHTVVITNRSPANIPFQFDRADLQSNDNASMLPMQGPTGAPPVTTPSQTPKSQPPPPTITTKTTTPISTKTVSPTTITRVGSAPVLQSSQVINSPPQSTVADSTSTGQPEITVSASALLDVVSSTPFQSSTVLIVTTDALGATVTQTMAVSGTLTSNISSPSENPTTNKHSTPGASKTSNPISVILATVFGTVAFLLILFATLICMRRRRRAHKKGGSARGLRSRVLNAIPYPFRHEAATVDSANEYPVGYTAIYRDEKRNQTSDPSNSPVGTNSSSFLNASQIFPPPTIAMTLPNPDQFNANTRIDEESTVAEAAPPAYRIELRHSERTSLGTSFYV